MKIRRPGDGCGEEGKGSEGKGPWRRRLLVAECFNGVEPGGSPGRVETEGDADGGTDDEGDNDPEPGKDVTGLHPMGDSIADPDTESNAQQPSEFAEKNGFEEELREEIPPAGADALSDSDRTAQDLLNRPIRFYRSAGSLPPFHLPFFTLLF